VRLEIIRNRAVSAEAPDRFRLLFVHGAACGAWVWANLLDWFTDRGIAAAALSLRGHGGSDGAGDLQRFGIRDYVDDLAGVIGAMPEPPVVVGHSMGGLVVQKLVETQAVPAAMLLASSPVGGMLRDSLRMQRHWPGLFLRAFLRHSLLTIYSTEASARWLLYTAETNAELILETQRSMQEESLRAVFDMLGLVRPKPKPGRLPMLVLAGAGDNMVSVASNERTARAWGAELAIIPRCGHMLPTDPAWPKVAEAMHAWLKRL
jgi:pimeloyl-ACP methyl ester carboxylesterase